MSFISWCEENGDYVLSDTIEEAIKDSEELLRECMLGPDSCNEAVCVIHKAIKSIKGRRDVSFDYIDFEEQETVEDNDTDK